MKNIFLKISSFVILVLCLITFTACGSKPSKKLWDKYVNAVNKGDLNAISECFTEPDTKDRANFTTDHADYLTNLKKIKTKSYNETINCSFSNSMNTQAYYLAEIEVVVNGSTTYNIKIYFYENNKGLFFCSYFNFEEGFEANEPNDYWKDKVYYHTDEFLYKDYPTGTVYIEETKNLKSAVVPAEIDGNKVTGIGEYAFYKYYKILSFTIPTSKLRNLIIEEGVDTIGKYAFYQCNKLKTLVIPESMRYIDRMAFANCSKLERLEFQTRTKESGSIIAIESESSGNHNGDELVITGAHNLQIGEILYLGAELGDNKVPRVEWSSSSEILTVNASTGKVTANKAGRATVTATLVENRAVTAKIEIVINEIEAKDCLKMYWDAFSRCGNLKEIYIHAYNPNSIIIDGGNAWLFNSTCKIYVPKGARDMYVSHTLWAKYADQIVEMEEDDAELTIDIALGALNLTKETSGNIYSAVNPNKIDNIIYLIQNGANYDLVNAYVGSKLLDNAQASVIPADTDKAKLYELLIGLIGELSIVLDDEDVKREDMNEDDQALVAEAINLIVTLKNHPADKIELTQIEFSENSLNPGKQLYRITYRYKTETDTEEEIINVYVNNNDKVLFDENYANIYDLIKIVMGSANKVEK